MRLLLLVYYVSRVPLNISVKLVLAASASACLIACEKRRLAVESNVILLLDPGFLRCWEALVGRG